MTATQTTKYTVQVQIQAGPNAGKWRTLRAHADQVLAERIRDRVLSDYPSFPSSIVRIFEE